MTVTYIYVTPEGEIVGSGIAQDKSHVSDMEGTKTIFNVSANPGTESFYSVTEGKVVAMPKKPGDNYKFNYSTKQWTLDVAAIELAARALREKLLQESDYTQYIDVTLPNKEAWATYRQALRDITKQSGFPTNITWPTKPV